MVERRCASSSLAHQGSSDPRSSIACCKRPRGEPSCVAIRSGRHAAPAGPAPYRPPPSRRSAHRIERRLLDRRRAARAAVEGQKRGRSRQPDTNDRHHGERRSPRISLLGVVSMSKRSKPCDRGDELLVERQPLRHLLIYRSWEAAQACRAARRAHRVRAPASCWPPVAAMLATMLPLAMASVVGSAAAAVDRVGSMTDARHGPSSAASGALGAVSLVAPNPIHRHHVHVDSGW